MSCFIARPSPADLQAFIAGEFSANVLGGAQIVPESAEWYVANNDYLAAEWYFSISSQAFAETQPATMCGDNLTAYFSALGIPPLAAQFARGYALLTGTAGAAIPASLSVSLNGAPYVLDSSVSQPAVLGADGSASVLLIAVVPGAAGNLTGASGTITSTAPGIDSAVTVSGAAFCGGSDPETEDQYRARGIARLQSPPNDDWNWLERTALNWPCLTRILPRSCNCCSNGRLEAYAMFDNTFAYGLAPQSVVDQASAWLFGSPNGSGLGQARIGLFGKLFTATALPVNISVTGLQCSADAWSNIQTQFAGIFSNLAPSTPICKRWFEAIITNNVPASCSFDVEISAASGQVISCGAEIDPGCDVLPVLGTVSGSPVTSCQ